MRFGLLDFCPAHNLEVVGNHDQAAKRHRAKAEPTEATVLRHEKWRQRNREQVQLEKASLQFQAKAQRTREMMLKITEQIMAEKRFT